MARRRPGLALRRGAFGLVALVRGEGTVFRGYGAWKVADARPCFWRAGGKSQRDLAVQ